MEKRLPSQSLFFKLLLLENATLLAVGVKGKKLTFKLQRTTDEYAAKCRIYIRPDQQKYTLSRHTDFNPALFLVLSVSY